MPEATIDLQNLLSEDSAPAPKPEEVKPELVDTPEEAAEVPSKVDEPPEEAKPVSLKDYAEEHDLNLKDLYKLTDGQGVSLSDLSNIAKDSKGLQTDRESFEQERVSFRTEKAQTTEQLTALQRAITSGESPEQAAEALKQLNQSDLEREQRMLLSVVSEWRDPTVKQHDVEAMVEFAGQFGLTAEDMGQIRDHRWLAMLRFNALQARRLKDLLNGAEKPKPKGVKAGKAKPDKAGGKAVNVTEMLTSRDF